MKAVCIAKGDGIEGVITFEQNEGEACKISARVTGLTPGLHGFHIHELGDLSNGCVSAKGHYNPFGKTHGGPGDDVRHVGDLGNIEADSDGVGVYTAVDDLVMLSGAMSVIGRSMVIHADTDDLGKGGHDDSLTTGHAGSRVACGVIGLGA